MLHIPGCCLSLNTQSINLLEHISPPEYNLAAICNVCSRVWSCCDQAMKIHSILQCCAKKTNPVLPLPPFLPPSLGTRSLSFWIQRLISCQHSRKETTDCLLLLHLPPSGGICILLSVWTSCGHFTDRTLQLLHLRTEWAQPRQSLQPKWVWRSYWPWHHLAVLRPGHGGPCRQFCFRDRL